MSLAGGSSHVNFKAWRRTGWNAIVIMFLSFLMTFTRCHRRLAIAVSTIIIVSVSMLSFPCGAMAATTYFIYDHGKEIKSRASFVITCEGINTDIWESYSTDCLSTGCMGVAFKKDAKFDLIGHQGCPIEVTARGKTYSGVVAFGGPPAGQWQSGTFFEGYYHVANRFYIDLKDLKELPKKKANR
jgi:hypothetical protein